MKNNPVLVAVMGTTASGKTDLAEQLADRLNAQLINADAFQAYLGMDIGTAKPSDKDRYRLLDVKSPDQSYGVGEFCELAQQELSRLFEQERSAIVVGGTGLYIRALFEEFDGLQSEPPAALRKELSERLVNEGLEVLVQELRQVSPEVALKTDLNNPVRVTRALERALNPTATIKIRIPPYPRLKLGLLSNGASINEAIEERAFRMVQNGWVQEVQRLLDQGFGPGDPGFRAIGYSEIATALKDETDLEEAIATTIAETRRYAKRQRTWLRSEPRLMEIGPANGSLCDEAMEAIRAVML